MRVGTGPLSQLTGGVSGDGDVLSTAGAVLSQTIQFAAIAISLLVLLSFGVQLWRSFGDARDSDQWGKFATTLMFGVVMLILVLWTANYAYENAQILAETFSPS